MGKAAIIIIINLPKPEGRMKSIGTLTEPYKLNTNRSRGHLKKSCTSPAAEGLKPDEMSEEGGQGNIQGNLEITDRTYVQTLLPLSQGKIFIGRKICRGLNNNGGCPWLDHDSKSSLVN